MAKMKLQTQIEDLLGKVIPLIDEKLAYTVSVSKEEDRNVVTVTINGDDLKLLIGYHAKTLQAWQQYLHTIISRYAALNKQTEDTFTLLFDIGNYRQEQDERVIKRAQEAIEQVKFLQEPFTLPPMSARHRRLVHLAVIEDGEVTSSSEGEGVGRRVIITLKSN